MTTEIEAEDRAEQIGDPPYIYSPYPDEIELVVEPETEGQTRVVEIIQEMWPCDIDELVEETKNREWGRNKNGYSGSFVRGVLRNHFAPAHEEVGVGEETNDHGTVEERIDRDIEENDRSRAYRAGLKIALMTDLDEESAADELATGFHEGRIVREEIEREQ